MGFKWFNKLIRELDNSSEIISDERNGFLFSLMVLSSYVIQADGKIMHSELEYIRNFLTDTFGIEKKESCERILMALFNTSKRTEARIWKEKIEKCTRELTYYTSEEDRLLLLAYLIKIVKADTIIEDREIESINDIATWLNISVAAACQIQELKTEAVWTWEI